MGQRFSVERRWLDWAVGGNDRRSPLPAIAGILATLGLLYAITLWVDDSRLVSATWYVPIVTVAAVRFRWSGAVVAALAGAALAGPLTPSDPQLSTGQRALGWTGRGLAFLLVGLVTAALVDALVKRIAAERDRELELAEQERALMSRQAAVIATVSHEFRTPITVIGGVARTLEAQGMVSAEGTPLLAGLTAATRRLTDLVNTVGAVLDDAGSDTFVRREPIILVELISHVLVNLGVRDAKSRVQIEIATGADVLVSDRELLGQLLRHVIDNAVRFSPPDEHVEVRARRVDGRLEVHVLDRGPGIDPRLLGSIEPFVQSDQSSTRTRGGLGLGLFAASRLAAALGGSIEFSARAGGGTDVVLDLSQQDHSTQDAIASTPGTIASHGDPSQMSRTAGRRSP